MSKLSTVASSRTNQLIRFSRLWLFVVLLSGGALSVNAADPASVSFNAQWRFVRAEVPQAQQPEFDDRTWETVTLPHTARIESLVTGQGARQWQGVCWYRKTFDLPPETRDREIILQFDGAMNAAEIWVNGRSAGKFMGGYLPYVMDISPFARPGETNVIAVRLDNRDNPVTGPKPLVDLDFNLYSGLYRDAHLIVKNKLHITDPNLAGKTAGGGVFVTFPAVSREQATINVRTQVKNDDNTLRTFAVRTILLDANGQAVASAETAPEALAAGSDREITQEIPVSNPKLWSPPSPSLYQMRSELIEQGKAVDTEQTRIGIRRIQITKDGFWINGEKMFLRGVNRHQEYPYLGNALSDDVQYRDALKIKEAGFDYVRLSHYPQSPAFLDACDQLGLVVMDSILGWQYFNPDPAFVELKYQECRELVRRDRNHPCVMLWEVSLNESDMPAAFIAQASAIAHEEYPGDQCYTCGWKDGYDVFLQARQHGGCRQVKDRPCLISEYGDWEYYAQNAGLEQEKWKDLQPAERSSRQLRGDGEARLLQQALNFQEAHNDNLRTTAFADSAWVMFDYNRGYAPDLESSGVMDIFRLPKFSYWFFRSQRDAGERVAGRAVGPVLFIANYWTANSPREVRVFSNCEEVALYLNGKLVERRRPDTSRASSNLKHAPFTFKPGRFQPGTLEAVGYLGGREVARCERRTPGELDGLALDFDLSDRTFAGGKDMTFCHASLQDKTGTLIPTGRVPVFFGTTGPAQLAGDNPIMSEAGIATILVGSDITRPRCVVYAICLANEKDQTRILSAAAAPDGSRAPDYKIHYTTDDTEPSATSPVYSGPVRNTPQLRAVIVVNDQIVARADSRTSAPATSDSAVAMAKANVQGE
ncbi:MAG: glycoside hydrolase family 2 TIM barrel-domain containing protein [Limisphaerales bacterium]